MVVEWRESVLGKWAASPDNGKRFTASTSLCCVYLWYLCVTMSNGDLVRPACHCGGTLVLCGLVVHVTGAYPSLPSLPTFVLASVL